MKSIIALGSHMARFGISHDILLDHNDLRTYLNSTKPDTQSPNSGLRDEISKRLAGMGPNFEVHATMHDSLSLELLFLASNAIAQKGDEIHIVIHERPEIVDPRSEARQNSYVFLAKTSMQIKNPISNPDYFDLLRELSQTLNSLRNEIRATNDHDRLDPEIRSTRAYIESFLAFLDEKSGGAPDTLPSELPIGLSDRLKRANWGGFSTHAQRWVETAIKIIEKLF